MSRTSTVNPNRERQAWIVAASVFITLFLVWGGGVNTGPVFLPPLLKYFGWTRARVSTLGSAGALMAGACGPFIGWLVDRIEARRVMLLGAIVTGAGLLAASRVHSYYPLLAANLMIAMGVTAATLIPASLVIAGWFSERRGLAMGLTFAGTSLGGAVMIVVANKAIAFGGWRAGYVAMALPMLMIVAPLVFFVVRSRPSARNASPELAHTDVEPIVMPGVELIEAFSTRSFWLIAIAEFFYACAIGGILVHLVVYLIGAGYTASLSASSLSMIYLMSTLGKLSMGPSADRLSPRTVLSLVFGGAAVGTILLFAAKSGLMLAGFIVLVGGRGWHTVGVAAAGVYPVAGAETSGLGARSSRNLRDHRRSDRPSGGGTHFRRDRQLRDRSWRVCGDVVGAALAIYACIPLRLQQELARLGRRTTWIAHPPEVRKPLIHACITQLLPPLC